MSIEENIEYQLEKLDQLMATLDISEKDSIKEEPESKDLEDIIYDFSSDDESKDDGNFVKIEQLEMGESSGTKRGPSYNWNTEFHREFSQAKTLLKPFQGLVKIEQMLNEVRKNSAENPTSNLVSEPGTQS